MAGTLLRRYVHGAGVDDPLVWYEGASTAATARRQLFADERGSIVAHSTGSGVVGSIYSYDDWGIPNSETLGASGSRFRYTGQIWLAELGMYYYKARIYSPTMGRFLQTDPIGYEDGPHLYAYVGNDPINARDPTGTYSCGNEFRGATCTRFQAAQDLARSRIALSLRVLRQLSARLASGEQLNAAERRAANRISTYLGAGRGVSRAAIGALISRGEAVDQRLASNTPARIGIPGSTIGDGDSGRYAYGTVFLHPQNFFGSSLNNMAFTLAHEGVHDATGGRVRDWSTTTVGAYGQQNARERARNWPQQAFDRNADTSVYALGLRRDGDEED